MNVGCRRVEFALGLALVICVLSLRMGYAGGKVGMEGWEKESAYNKLYDPTEADKFKGFVVELKEVTPLPGMAPGLALVVKDSDGEMVTVHLGPRSFVNPNHIGIRKGDKVTVKGVWAEISDKDVFIASKVKKGDFHEYKVRRTRDGIPYWTMTSEELAKETAAK